MNFETEKIEFKSGFTEDIYKEVIAFANTNGGILYIGIDNTGNEIGLDNVDREYTRVTNGIRDAILPDVTMFVRFTIQKNRVLCITVEEGTNKPYYLKGKGLKPNGVYIRQGASSAPASQELIRRMIKETDGENFEEMRSLEQNLSFSAAETAFAKYGVEFNETKYMALGIAQKKDELFTNLALILSDQCSHRIKIAVFGDDGNTVFKDNREFGGSIFRQLDDTFSYLMLCNKTEATIKGLERIEKRDYPDEAIREALLNALVHRDYGFSGSVIINVNNKEMEFISIGGLPFGLSPDDIRAGISQPRNKLLAEVFHRLHLIESYGTGIRRIFNLYSACPVQPRIEVTSNTFKIVLPNMNAVLDAEKEVPFIITPQMKKIIDHIAKNGHITDAEIEMLLGIKHTRIYTLTKEMSEMGLIYKAGKGKEKKYRLS